MKGRELFELHACLTEPAREGFIEANSFDLIHGNINTRDKGLHLHFGELQTIKQKEQNLIKTGT